MSQAGTLGRSCRSAFMRRSWIVSIAILIALAAAAYAASPYIAVARFARAAQARETAAVMERIDLPVLRLSIARQVSRAFIAKNPDIARKSPLGPQAGAAVIGGFVNAYLTETFTPEVVEAMLTESRPPASLGRESLSFPSLSNIDDGLSILKQAGFTGLTRFAVDGARGPEGAMRLGFALQGVTWRLTSLQLPQPWLDRLVAEIGQKIPQG